MATRAASTGRPVRSTICVNATTSGSLNAFTSMESITAITIRAASSNAWSF
ncbi:hypothetical protein [Cryobacterium sp. TMB3-1-2]|uniref:hypothetical protein n=1 Tax=Cryobacterium sp. TMB3-1-2 TaxID=1259208 RepID=UPI00141AD5AB|nr:hypothetical protein [Cryobacterium sp. TMB3-1-2]